MPPILSFCAEPNGEVAESIIQHNPRPRREGGTVEDGGWGPEKNTFSYPSSGLGALSLQGEGVPSLIEAVDSATPGKPCVQNDMISGFRIEYETLPTTFIDR